MSFETNTAQEMVDDDDEYRTDQELYDNGFRFLTFLARHLEAEELPAARITSLFASVAVGAALRVTTYDEVAEWLRRVADSVMQAKRERMQ